METKYDWEHVPEYINYIAVDSDGWANGYKAQPALSKHDFKGEFSHYILKPTEHGFKGNWQESLEERPKNV